MVVLMAALGGCRDAPMPVTTHVAVPATLDLPPVPGAPATLEVVLYGQEPEAGPQPGSCAIRLRDLDKYVDWDIDAAQAWDSTEVRGDTTFVRHLAIGDYVPRIPGAYAMTPGQVARVDCASYRILGLTRAGG
jgi:hypothetical protein